VKFMQLIHTIHRSNDRLKFIVSFGSNLTKNR
jgi:hypothetical protein